MKTTTEQKQESKIQAADEIAFINGAIKRSITVESLENLAKTGKAVDLNLLKRVLSFRDIIDKTWPIEIDQEK